MKDWTIGKRLVMGFVAVLTIVLAAGTFAIMQVLTIKADATRVVIDSLPGTALSGQLTAAVKDNYAFTVRLVHAETQSEVQEIEQGMAATTQEITKLLADYERTITQADDRQNFDAIKPAREQFLGVKADIGALVKGGQGKEALEKLRRDFEPSYRAYLDRVKVVSDWNIKAGADVGALIDAHVSSAVTGVSIGVLASVLMAAVLAFFIVRGTNNALRAAVDELTTGSEQVVAAAGQVATSAQALSQGSTEQAASLEETSASMEEMASMTRQNAESTQEAASLMHEVDGRVGESNQALEEMVSSMSAIQESSQKVGKIIKTIDEIAFQTNILALNAAVEAARAGEAGMGFAVVADEVRNLAQRSAQAAKDTAGLIEESIGRAQGGSVKVGQVASAIASITDSVVKVKGLVEQVSMASRQQAQGIDQVSQAIAQMEKVTQTTAATAEESAAASEELNAQAETSMQIVRHLESLVGGSGAAQGRVSPASRARRAMSAAPSKARVLKLAGGGPSAPPASAEEALPLGDTGTYGRF